MKPKVEQTASPTNNPEEQLDWLLAHWNKHGNLDGVILPEGSEPRAISLAAIKRRLLAEPGGIKLCDTIFCLPVGEQKPIKWDAFLTEYPPDQLMRALVEHGTPGAISLDTCPFGTLIATASEIRMRVQQGLELMSLQPQITKTRG